MASFRLTGAKCYNADMADSLPLDYEPGAGPPGAVPEIDAPKGALAIIFLIVFMDLLGFGIIIPLLPLFAKRFNATDFDVGLVFSVFSACQFFASPILGAISDRYGRRPVLIFSQLGSAIGYVMLGLAMQFQWANPFHGLMLIYFSRLVDGISGGNISAAQAYISDVTTPQNRAKGMGILGAAFGVGFAIGPAVGAALVPIHPALPGYFAAFMSLAAMTMTALRLRETRVHRPAESGMWLHPARFAPIFRHGRLVQLLLIGFVSMAAFVMLESMVALFLSDRQTFSFHEWQVGLYYAYLGIIIAGVQGGLTGRLTRRFGEWPLAIIGPLMVVIGMASLVLVSIKPLLVILLVGGAINAAGRSLQTPNLFSLISKNSDQKEQGLVFGLNQGLSSIARVIGPIIAALVYHWRHAAPFGLAAILGLIVVFWTIALRSSGVDRASYSLADRAGEAESV